MLIFFCFGISNVFFACLAKTRTTGENIINYNDAKRASIFNASDRAVIIKYLG